jgi:Icc-related predicted phosphoesterase
VRGGLQRLRLVALSDTHKTHTQVKVPEGDVLIYAGDFCTHGFSYGEIFSFRDWFLSQPHKHKIFISGNHDRLMELQPQLAEEFKDCHYLFNSGVTINGVSFWGSPYTPWFNNWAFNLWGVKNLRSNWAKIPHQTNVLITHGPPYGILDGPYLGDQQLCEAIYEKTPDIHIFGHIHCGYGTYTFGAVNFYNVSICDDAYNPVNEVTIIDYGN